MSIGTALSAGLVALLSLAPGGYWGCDGPTAGLGGTVETGFVGTGESGLDDMQEISFQNDRLPIVAFETLADGAVINEPVQYGSIQVRAFDPDAGTTDGEGIDSVAMVVTDASTGQIVAARTEYWASYDFGPKLDDGVYTLTATAYGDWFVGGSQTTKTITVTVDVAGTTVVTPSPTSPPPPTVIPTRPVLPRVVPTSPPAPTAVPTSPPAPTPVPAAPTAVPTSPPAPTPVPAAPTAVPTSPPAPTPVPAAPTAVPTSPPAPTPVPAAPTAVPTTAPAPALTGAEGTAASLAAFNQVRANVGLPPLSLNATLSSFALDWSKTMSQSGFRHSGGPYGENIAWYSDGSLTPQDAADFFNTSWVNSPGHYANMIHAGYTEIGIALYRDAGGWWATHVFR